MSIIIVWTPAVLGCPEPKLDVEIEGPCDCDEYSPQLCGSVADIDGKGSKSGQGKEGVAWPDVLCCSVADIDGKGSKSGQGKEGMA